jgi:hypothetical protein
MEEGEIQVDSIQPIGFPDITPELARESGFLGVLDRSKSRNTVEVRIFIWSDSTMCDRVPSK